MQYSKAVLHHFLEARHVGKLNKDDPHVRYAEIGSKVQGYLFRLYLYHQNNFIQEAKFQAYGSVTATAACENICRWARGKSLEEARQLNKNQIQKALSLSSLEIHTAVLIEQLWKKSIKDNNYVHKV